MNLLFFALTFVTGWFCGVLFNYARGRYADSKEFRDLRHAERIAEQWRREMA